MCPKKKYYYIILCCFTFDSSQKYVSLPPLKEYIDNRIDQTSLVVSVLSLAPIDWIEQHIELPES